MAHSTMSPRNLIVHEREHVGGGVVAAVRVIQGVPFRGIDEAHRHTCVAVERGECPAPKQGACRKIVTRGGILNA
jgi:hypothetical protein